MFWEAVPLDFVDLHRSIITHIDITLVTNEMLVAVVNNIEHCWYCKT